MLAGNATLSHDALIITSLQRASSNVHCGAWWLIGIDDALQPEGRGCEYRSVCHVGTLGKVLHFQLPVAPRRVNSDTASTAVVWSASERLVL